MIIVTDTRKNGGAVAAKSKKDLGKPAAWAITQNEKLWTKFDSVDDRSVVVGWSLGDDYRTRMMTPGDRTIFWVTGPNGGIARMGFVLEVSETPGGEWEDASGKSHPSPFSGYFFLPPFPNRRYIHRSSLVGRPKMAKCELLTNAAQRPAPLRIEKAEWKVIQAVLCRFDKTSNSRAAWS